MSDHSQATCPLCGNPEMIEVLEHARATLKDGVQSEDQRLGLVDWLGEVLSHVKGEAD